MKTPARKRRAVVLPWNVDSGYPPFPLEFQVNFRLGCFAKPFQVQVDHSGPLSGERARSFLGILETVQKAKPVF